MSKDLAVGLIETRGIVALTAGMEAMMKTADVSCLGIERVASGYFAVAVQGSLAAVRQAIDSGRAAVSNNGELRRAAIFPKPHEAALSHLDQSFSERLASRQK